MDHMAWAISRDFRCRDLPGEGGGGAKIAEGEILDL